MSSADDISTGFGRPSSLGRDMLLWGSAGLIVLAVHSAGAWYLTQQAEALPDAAVEEAMMVDLTPMLETTPDSVESETLTEEPPTEMAAADEPVEAEEPEELVEEIVPEQQEPLPEETVTEAEPEEIKPEITEPEPDLVTEEPIEEEPTVTLPDSDVPMPVARPEPRREIVRERPRPRRETPRQETREPQRRVTQDARPQPRSQASREQRASSAPRVSPARWNSQAARKVQQSSQRAVRRIRGTGTVVISFAVSASGSIGNVRVSRSSGNPEIDSAVVSAVRGINLPAPPNGAQSVTIPVLKDR